MGTKGYLLAPYHARALVKHMCWKDPLPQATDVQRFY
jgi:hypothetical protein